MDSKFPLSNKVEGGTTVRDFEAILDDRADKIGFVVPIYVREGAIIPTIELEQYVNQRNKEGKDNPITLNIYPGNQGQYTMYLDDGESRASAKKEPLQCNNDPEARGEYREVKIFHRTLNANTREIKIERGHDNYTPRETYFFIVILHHSQEPKGSSGPLNRITIGGQNIELIQGNSVREKAEQLNTSENNGWYYNETNNSSYLKVFDDNQRIVIYGLSGQ